MAIRTVITRGYGNGTFNGTIALAVLRGYSSAASVTGGCVAAAQVYHPGVMKAETYRPGVQAAEKACNE